MNREPDVRLEVTIPQCMTCIHLKDLDDRHCSAFPGGIPSIIWLGQHDHAKPYPGDSGIRYRLDPGRVEL